MRESTNDCGEDRREEWAITIAGILCHVTSEGVLLDCVTVELPNDERLEVLEVRKSDVYAMSCVGESVRYWEYDLSTFNDWVRNIGATIRNEDTNTVLDHAATPSNTDEDHAQDTIEPFNNARTIHNILRKVQNLDYCEKDCWILDGYANPRGGHVYVYTPDRSGKSPAHRVMARTRLSPEDNIPVDWHCHHECRTPRCVNPDHLVWLPPDEHNIADRRQRAENADPDDDRISAEEIREIRYRYDAQDISQKELADEYGLTQQMVSNIVRREQYWYI